MFAFASKSLLTVVCVVCIHATASAEPATMIYTGPLFNSFYFQGATPPDAYTATDHVSGTMTLASPLGANLVGAYVDPISFSFFDGVNTITNADPALDLRNTRFQFWTDGSGQVINWAVNVFAFTAGVYRATVQTLYFPTSLGCGINCAVDEGTQVVCGGVVGCLDADGNLNIDPLFNQFARIDGAAGEWTNMEPLSFRGFFSPVDNDPIVNRVKAGAGVPVKFSLGGDRGLNIFQGGFPASQPVACDNFAVLATVEETVGAGKSGLTYDPLSAEYTYVWKTQSGWANTCRQLVLRLADGSFHVASFQFKK